MPRSIEVYLNDMLHACEKVSRFTAEGTFASFRDDERTVDAVLRNLEIIGEAARQIPEPFRKLHERIDWRRLTAMRNLLIHNYSGIDLDIVWDIVRNKIPVLNQALRQVRDESADRMT